MRYFGFCVFIKFFLYNALLWSSPERCADLFEASVIRTQDAEFDLALKRQQLQSISRKLSQHFGSDWQENLEDFDHYSANLIFKYLQKFGSSVDLDIFETYISILLNTSGDFQLRERGLFYIDNHLGERPKSTHFRELHWDWSIFIGYFSTTPSVIHFTKAEDLAYLKEVLAQAVEQNRLTQRPPDLADTLVLANRNWHLKTLQKVEPEMAKHLINELMPSLKSPSLWNSPTAFYQERFKALSDKVERFKQNAQSAELDTLFTKRLDETLGYFKNCYSELDLYLFTKYFDLILKMPVDELKAQSQTDKKLQLSNWQVFYFGLPFGSIEYFTDFIFQNSHDTAMKAHLLKILIGMERLLSKNKLKQNSHSENSFFGTFTLARTYIENDAQLSPRAKIHQSDLRIFTVNADIGLSAKSQEGSISQWGFPRYDEIFVSWNPFLAKLQANVIASYSIQSQNTAKMGGIKKLREYFKVYFDTLRQNQTVPDEWINEFEQEEMNASLARSSVFAFTEPDTEKLLALVRIFDGSNLELRDQHEQWLLNHEDHRLPVEQAFPVVHIPETQNHDYVLEIGRVLATKDIIANSYDTMMARIAEYFKVRGMRGVIYLSSPAAMARYNQRKGATVIYTPEQLANQPHTLNSVYILKITIDDFIKKFLKPEYESVQLRDSPRE